MNEPYAKWKEANADDHMFYDPSHMKCSGKVNLKPGMLVHICDPSTQMMRQEY
jgi:hypothetical protein